MVADSRALVSNMAAMSMSFTDWAAISKRRHEYRDAFISLIFAPLICPIPAVAAILVSSGFE